MKKFTALMAAVLILSAATTAWSFVVTVKAVTDAAEAAVTKAAAVEAAAKGAAEAKAAEAEAAAAAKASEIEAAAEEAADAAEGRGRVLVPEAGMPQHEQPCGGVRNTATHLPGKLNGDKLTGYSEG